MTDEVELERKIASCFKSCFEDSDFCCVGRLMTEVFMNDPPLQDVFYLKEKRAKGLNGKRMKCFKKSGLLNSVTSEFVKMWGGNYPKETNHLEPSRFSAAQWKASF